MLTLSNGSESQYFSAVLSYLIRFSLILLRGEDSLPMFDSKGFLRIVTRDIERHVDKYL